MANPLEILGAYRTNYRMEESAKAIEALAGDKLDRLPAFEDVLRTTELDLLRGERALLNALDSGRDDEQDRKLGRSKNLFDSLIDVQVAQAVGQTYSGNDFLDPKDLSVLGADDFLTASGALKRSGPDLSKIKKTVEEEVDDPDTRKMLGSILNGLVKETFRPDSTSDFLSLGALGSSGGVLPDTYHPMQKIYQKPRTPRIMEIVAGS